MVRAVAQVVAARARPLLSCQHLIDVLTVAHEQAVAAELAVQGVAGGAARAFAQCFLAALVAGHSVFLVVDLQHGVRLAW